MIEMRVLKGNRIGPVIICDHCGKPITDIGSALAKFDNALYGEPEGTTRPFKTLHKGSCDKAAGTSLKYAWFELKESMIQAVINGTPLNLRGDRDKVQEYISEGVRGAFEAGDVLL